MRSAHRPTTTRSAGRRLGDRFREGLRISSWCLTSTDSATTERAPPGPASRATVASRCRKRTARSRTAQSYQDRDTGKESSRILEFARHTCIGDPQLTPKVRQRAIRKDEYANDVQDVSKRNKRSSRVEKWP